MQRPARIGLGWVERGRFAQPNSLTDGNRASGQLHHFLEHVDVFELEVPAGEFVEDLRKENI